MVINKERLVQTFCEMVSIDSESYHEKKMKDYLMKVFKECHMECIEMPIEGFEAGNIYAVLKGDVHKEPIMFSGHMDTVHQVIGSMLLFMKMDVLQVMEQQF